jgi:nucleoid-associated protein YgaU
MSKKITALFVFGLVLGSLAFAQNLQDNEYYRKSVEFANLSQQALDKGEYVESAEYARQSQEYAALSKKYIEEMLFALRARNSYFAAKARLDAADRARLRNREPDLYAEAAGVFKSATKKFNAKDWNNSIPESRRVVELLKDFESRLGNRPPERGGLAAFYEVKLNPGRRDCLWRIAGFDFVYGDSFQWKRLYDANKEKFPEPGNPDLIEPGMILKIPSIRGETRSGTR